MLIRAITDVVIRYNDIHISIKAGDTIGFYPPIDLEKAEVEGEYEIIEEE